jgi:transcription elongation factor GreA
MKKVPMTVEGEARLREELNHLKTVVRPRVIADIATAREHGDLKENAEYHAAREEQGFAEGRIKEIEGKLSDSQVIDVKSVPASSKVIFGTTVTLFNVNTEDTVTYKIVGDDESDVKEKKISYASPIAKAIIGKEEGDEVVVKIPSGEATYEIEKVEYI